MTQTKSAISGWSIAALIGAIFAFTEFHDRFFLRDDGEVAIRVLSKQIMVQARTQAITTKNQLRGRLASYDGISEKDITPVEKKNRAILKFDLQQQEEQIEVLNLEVPE